MAKTKPDTKEPETLPGAIQIPEVGDTIGKWKIKRRVTTPLVSLTYNNQLIVKVEGEISYGDSAMSAKEGDKPMAVVPVIDMTTGESVTLICPTVLESAFRRVPGGYVGKTFAVMQGAKAPGKRYFQVELFEVE